MVCFVVQIISIFAYCTVFSFSSPSSAVLLVHLVGRIGGRTEERTRYFFNLLTYMYRLYRYKHEYDGDEIHKHFMQCAIHEFIGHVQSKSLSDAGFANSPRGMSLSSTLQVSHERLCFAYLTRHTTEATEHATLLWDPTKKAKLWPRQNTGIAATRNRMERIPPTNGSEATKPSSLSSKRTCSRQNRQRHTL